MQVKVVKFGGSSLADAEHFRQVAGIIRADSARRYVVPSAPGKRFSGDEKVTDMLYGCYELIRNRESIDEEYARIKERYNGIIRDLGLDLTSAASWNTSRTPCSTVPVGTMPQAVENI